MIPFSLGLAWPRVSADPAASASIPFWLVFTLAAVPTAILWHRDRRTANSSSSSNGSRPDAQIPGHGPDIDQYLHQGAPDWTTISFDVLCSRCGYNLRTLSRPQCTECGLEFEWPAMLDAAAWRSDFLFEHHWRTRPFQSWFKTVWLSFRPYRFWSRVSIHEAIEPKPLLGMLLSAVMAFVLAFHGTALVGAVVLSVLDRWIYPTGGGWPPAVAWNPSPLESVSQQLGELAALPFNAGSEYLYLPGGILVTLLAAVGLMCSLRQTLAHCRVRSAQILRVMAYAATPICVLAGVVLAVDAGLIPVLEDVGPVGVAVIISVAATPFVIFGAFLGIGLRCYLRLRHGLTVGFVTAFVAILFSFTAFVFSRVV